MKKLEVESTQLDNLAILRHEDGTIYCGMTSGNETKVGLGYMRFNNSAFFIGEFLKDTYNGLGYFRIPTYSNTHTMSRGISYLGEFYQGLRHGVGKLKTYDFEYVG
jgi:hypothetical protein